MNRIFLKWENEQITVFVVSVVVMVAATVAEYSTTSNCTPGYLKEEEKGIKITKEI